MPPLKNKRRRYSGHGCQGFTLLEMMAVVAIIGILAAIAYPTYQDAVRKARRAEGWAVLMQLMQQQERYFSTHTSYIAFSSEAVDEDEKKFKWFSGASASSSAYEIKAAHCLDETIKNCVVVSAVPGTSKVNAAFSDPACGTLSITSTGVKAPADNRCW